MSCESPVGRLILRLESIFLNEDIKRRGGRVKKKANSTGIQTEEKTEKRKRTINRK